MKISLLDAFVLSVLDRGARSAYDMRRDWGISLGASLPSLKRLSSKKLVSREKGRGATNRPRNDFRLTEAGKRSISSTWKRALEGSKAVVDLDSILRIADMAAHYGAEARDISEFLIRAAQQRRLSAKKAALSAQPYAGADKLAFPVLRAGCEANRLRAEADALQKIASIYDGKNRKRRK